MRTRIFALAAGTIAAFAMLFAGTAAANASNKPDATPACGAGCFNLSSLLLGTSQIQTAYLNDRGGLATGHAGILMHVKLATDTNPNQDYTASVDTTLGQACSDGEITPTSYVCTQYGDWVPGTGFTSTFPVIEPDWSPFGNQSGFCVGVAAAVAGEAVTFQPCGVSARTLWVEDANDAHIGASPWISAADTSTSHPLVLTVRTGKVKPSNRESLQPLNLLNSGFVSNGQMWDASFGPEV